MHTVRTIAPGQVELVEEAAPEPDGAHVVIRVERVGLCGSDVALFHGTHPYSTFPTVQGHECSGVVADVGSRDDLAVGDLVAVEPLIPCHACYACRRGRPNCCRNLLVFGAHVPGALREVVAVDPVAVFAAGALTPETAALAEPVSIAVHAVGRGGIAAGESTLVLGAGPIGLAVLVAARDRGANVVVADRSARRLQLAAALGADLVVNTTETDLVSAVMEHTGREGMEVVVDASGAPELVRSGFEAAAHSGRVVLVGISLRDLAVPLNEYVRKELTVVGSRNNCGEFASAIDLVARNQERLATLVSHRFPLADAGAALRLASEGSDSAGKILIEVA